MKFPVARTRVALCCLAVLCSGLVANASTTRLSPARGRAVQSKMVAPEAVLSVEIDVQSAEANRTIDLSSTGSVQIAVLGGKGIDVTTIDPGSLTVSGARPIMISPGTGKPGSVDPGSDDTGRSATESRPALFDTELRDVNGDGRQDLLVAFPVQHLTELEEGLESVRLEGRTFGGTAISGTQTIVARGTRQPVCCDGNHPESPAATTCNASAITINDNTTATPYPSPIVVSGETGVISNLTVTLTGISHTFPDDIQMLLVGPGGQKVVIMAGASNGAPITNVNLTFDDAATNSLPATGAIASGTFKPTAHAGLLNFAAPAPAATTASPFAYTLGAFRNTSPNGTWNLFVRDVIAGDFGSISGGWCVNITTAASASTCMTLNAGAIAAGDPTQTGRLVRNGVFSVCSALKPSPGLNDSVLGRRFDQYTITNQNTTTQCVTASVSNGCGANAIYLAAYTGSYVPTSVTTNFLADNGASPGTAAIGIGPVAFTMAPGATVVLVVHEITANSGCASYGLLVEGDICPPPCVVTCPANVTQSNDSNQCGAVVTYPLPTTTGSCGTVTCAPASGSFFPVGTTTVTCTPTTGSPCSFTVTVNDTQAPTITCPGNQGATESPSGSGSATVNYPAPTVSDNCPGVGSPTCVPPSGSSFPLGSTTVNCSVSDAAMNTANCSFTVTVTAGCAMTCPANVTVSNDANQCGAVVTYPAPTVSGMGCGTITCSPVSGSFFPVGMTTVNCSETSGATCSFTVTVNDTQPPTITCPANVTASNTPGMCSAVVNYGAVSATDNCTAPAIVCSQPSGSTFPVGTTTVTCTATDAASNTATCSFTVTVNDTQAPTITCPANVTATANTMQGGVPGANATYPAPTVTDNCPGVVTTVCTPASGSFFPQGTTTVNCTATDPGGNSASCSFTVTVSVTFDVCFDEQNGNTLSFVTNPMSVLRGYWEYRIAATNTIYSGYAEFLTYVPNRSLIAYDHDSTNVRMDTNANFNTRTATATIRNLVTGTNFAFRDRDTTNNPFCGGAPPPPTD